MGLCILTESITAAPREKAMLAWLLWNSQNQKHQGAKIFDADVLTLIFTWTLENRVVLEPIRLL